MDDFLFDDLLFPEEFNQDKALIDRYNAQKNDTSSFYDVNEFEVLIEYFIFTFEINEAMSIVSRAISQHPDSVSIKMKKAYLYIIGGQLRKAMKLLQKLVVLEPSNYEIHHLMGMTYSKTGKFESSKESYIKALNVCPREEKVQILVDLAIEYSSKGMNDEAIKLLAEAVKIDPKEDFAVYELQFSLQRANRQSEGPSFFNQIIDANPYSVAAWFNLAVCYGHSKEFTKAVESYDYALAINENHTPSLFNKGNILYQMGEYQKALDTYNLVANLEDPMPITYCNMGECYEQLMDFQNAIKYFNKALEMDPEFADAYIGIAIAEDLLGNAEKSIVAIKNALKLSPSNSDYHHFYAEMLKKDKQYDKAIEIFEKSLLFSNPNITVFLGFFDCLFITKQDEKAMKTISVAFNKFGEQDELNVRFLALLTRQGKVKKASILLEALLNSNQGIGRKFISYHPQAIENKEVLELINEYSR